MKNMIYSPDINKVCALCTRSEPIPGTTERLMCALKKDVVPLDGTCEDFDYDIFKKPTHRRRRLKKKFSADDFKL